MTTLARSFATATLLTLLTAAPSARPAEGPSASSRPLESASEQEELETPIVRLEELVGAPLYDSDGRRAARLHDWVLHRRTGLVTRVVVRCEIDGVARLKAIPSTQLSWDETRRVMRLRAAADSLEARPDFDPARIVRASERWVEASAGRGDRSSQRPLLHVLARAQVGRALHLEGATDAEPFAKVGTLYVAPAEGRVVAWSAHRESADATSELLLPWPVVEEAPRTSESAPEVTRLSLALSVSIRERLVRYAPRAPRDLGTERPRLRALFRLFGEEPPNALLPRAEQLLLTRAR